MFFRYVKITMDIDRSMIPSPKEILQQYRDQSELELKDVFLWAFYRFTDFGLYSITLQTGKKPKPVDRLLRPQMGQWGIGRRRMEKYCGDLKELQLSNIHCV